MLARSLAVVTLAALAAATSGSASKLPGYDPIAIAVDELAAMGTPPPAGYTIVEVPPGSIPGSHP